MKYIKYIVIVFFVALISISSTILITNHLIDDKSVDNIYINNCSTGIDINGTYFINDIDIYDEDYFYNDIKFTISKIKGLKNKEIEKIINTDLNNKYKELIEEKKYTYLTTLVSGNFSNILSIEIYASDNSSSNNSTTYYMNYNLNDGSYIRFSDLFTDDANVNLIVRNAFYEERAHKKNNAEISNRYNKEDKQNNIVYVDDDMLNNEVIKFIKLDDLKKKFLITPISIRVFSQNDKLLGSINYKDNISEIAAYSRYVLNKGYSKDISKIKSNIYDGTICNANSIFTLSNYTDSFIIDIINEEVSSNLYVDFGKKSKLKKEDVNDKITCIDVDEFNKDYDEYVEKDVYSLIKEIKKVSNIDKKHYYILMLSLEENNIKIYQEELKDKYDYYVPTNMISYHLVTNLFIIPMKLYKSKYKNIVRETYMNDKYLNLELDRRLLIPIGNKKYASNYNDSDILNIYNFYNKMIDYSKEIEEAKSNSKNKIVLLHHDMYLVRDYKNHKSIDSLEDMFIDGIIDEDDMEEEFRNNMIFSWKKYSKEKTNNLMNQGLDITLANDSIIIRSNKDNEEWCSISYDDFDIDCFKSVDEEVLNEINTNRGE